MNVGLFYRLYDFEFSYSSWIWGCCSFVAHNIFRRILWKYKGVQCLRKPMQQDEIGSMLQILRLSAEIIQWIKGSRWASSSVGLSGDNANAPNSLNWDCQLQEERMMSKPFFQSPTRVDPYMVKCLEDGSMAWSRLYSAHKKHFGKTPGKPGTVRSVCSICRAP